MATRCSLRWRAIWMLVAVWVLLLPVSQAQAPGPAGVPQAKPMAADANPAFEVATIKPSDPEARGRGLGLRGHNFSAHNFSVADLLVFAYGVQSKQVVGGPGWVGNAKFDIAAIPDVEGQPSRAQWNAMVQKLMADRFKLVLHHEQRELAAYVLSVGKNGAKLTRNDSGDPGPGALNMSLLNGECLLVARNATVPELAALLQQAAVDRPVVNRTGLSGKYDVRIMFAPDGAQFGGSIPIPKEEATSPSLFTAIQDLGLKLDAVKAPVDTIVIDSVERPSQD